MTRAPESIVRDVDPRSETRAGLAVGAGLTAVVVAFGILAPLDAAAIGVGRVSTIGREYAVQGPEAAKLSAVLVREGAHVKRGDELFLLDTTQAAAEQDTAGADIAALWIKRARLEADLDSRRVLPSSAWLEASRSAEARQLWSAAQADLAAATGRHDAELQAFRLQIESREKQIATLKIQATAGQERIRALSEQLKSYDTLARDGYAPMLQVRAAEANLADARATVAGVDGNITMLSLEIRRLKAEQAAREQDRRASLQAELAETLHAIDAASPRLGAARARAAAMRIVAPEAGWVQLPTHRRIGGVVGPGDVLAKIVPDGEPLMVSGAVPAEQGEGLRPGMVAEVRLKTAATPAARLLRGRLRSVAPDSTQEGQAEVDVYMIEVELAGRDLVDAWGPVRPGLPVDIVIPLRKRSALTYLLEPVGRSVWSGFRRG
jgi:HlyD family secretion protein